MAAGTGAHGLTQDELNELLEAFAANTLTPAQRIRLNEAARRDERLLCALADPDELRAVVQHPVHRTRLLLDLQDSEASGHGRRQRPWLWLTVCGAAIAAVLIIGLQLSRGPASDPLSSSHSLDAPTASVRPPEPPPPAVQPQEEPIQAPAPEPPPAVVSKEQETPKPVERSESVTRRNPAPFGPLVEERVVDDEVIASAGKRAASPARSKTELSRDLERAPDAPPTRHEQAKRPLPAEPAPLPQHQASRPVPAVPKKPPQEVRGARALFYGEGSRATPAGLGSHGDDEAMPLQTEPQAAPSPALDEPAPLAVRYSLIVGTPEGTDQEVDPKTPVRLSDRPRLAVQTNQDGYLLVTDLPSASDIGIAPTAIKSVQARTSMIFPLAGLTTDTTSASALRLRIAFSRRRLDPAGLLSQAPGPLLEERVERGEPAEHAVYAAAPSQSGSPLLMVEVTLNQPLQATPPDVARPGSAEEPVP